MVQGQTKKTRRCAGEKENFSVRFTVAGQRLSPVERELINRKVQRALSYKSYPQMADLDEQSKRCCQEILAQGTADETAKSHILSRSVAPFSHLLSADEERNLFMQMNYARLCLKAEAERARKRKIPISQGKRILRLDRVESNARKHLVESNMPLVLSMAKRMHINGVDFGDVISEGNMALLRAVDGFDYSRGFKFSTYACRAIIKSFARLAQKNNKYRMRFPTEFDPAYEKSDWQQTRYQETAEYCTEELVKILQDNSASLNETELEVIRGRFAFGADSKRKTLMEMGKILSLTKERIRQIQKKAVSKLREALEVRITGNQEAEPLAKRLL